jgi:hypothetical protein
MIFENVEFQENVHNTDDFKSGISEVIKSQVIEVLNTTKWIHVVVEILSVKSGSVIVEYRVSVGGDIDELLYVINTTLTSDTLTQKIQDRAKESSEIGEMLQTKSSVVGLVIGIVVVFSCVLIGVGVWLLKQKKKTVSLTEREAYELGKKDGEGDKKTRDIESVTKRFVSKYGLKKKILLAYLLGYAPDDEAGVLSAVDKVGASRLVRKDVLKVWRKEQEQQPLSLSLIHHQKAVGFMKEV